jgi:hypothetical protein
LDESDRFGAGGQLGEFMKRLTLALLAFALGCSPHRTPPANTSQPAPVASAPAAAKSNDRELAKQKELSKNNLRKIGIAFYAQQDQTGAMHFLDYDDSAQKESKLSWRVGLLPYLGLKELYDRFHHDELWDSEHNSKLLDEMPEVFAPVNGAKALKGYTFYRVFDVYGPRRVAKSNSSFPDGAATTILVVEGGEAIPWTKPDLIAYDPAKPLPKLGGMFGGDFGAVMADGSPQFFPKTIPEKVLRALITPAGHEKVEPGWLK